MSDRHNPLRTSRLDQETDTSDLMRREVRRQRNIILLCTIVVALGLMLGFGGIFGDKQAGEQDPAGTSGTAPKDAEPAKAKPTPKPAVGRDQSQALVTEITTVVAWPWAEMLETESWLPKDAAWLPAMVEHIGSGLYLDNRVLEAGSVSAAARSLPRTGPTLEFSDLYTIACAAESQNLIVVEFLRGSGGWKVHGYRWEQPTDAKRVLVSRAMPEKDRARSLTADIALALSELTDWGIRAGPSLAQTDEAGRVMVDLEVEAASLLFSRNQNKMNERLAAQVAKAKQLEPDFDFPVVRAAQYLRAAELTANAVALLRGWSSSETMTDAVKLELGSALVSLPDQEQIQAGLDMLLELVAKDRLNMTAYQTWGQAEFARTPGPGLNSRGDIERAKEGMERYPADGRFQALMAALMSVDPETAKDAIPMAAQALKLRPWNPSIGYHKAMALYTVAWSGVLREELDANEAVAAYFDAANALADAWRYNTNRLENWLPLMFRCLTQNETKLPEAIMQSNRQVSHRVGFIYMVGLVCEVFLSETEIRRGMARFRNHRPQLDAYVKAQAAQSTPDSNNHELIMLADVALAFREHSERRKAQPEPEITQSEIDRVTAAFERYRATGARAPQVEDSWKAIQALLGGSSG